MDRWMVLYISRGPRGIITWGNLGEGTLCIIKQHNEEYLLLGYDAGESGELYPFLNDE
jgi:hypothetical protein